MAPLRVTGVSVRLRGGVPGDGDGQGCPPLPDDLWEHVFGVTLDGLKIARSLAAVCQLFSRIALTHEDNEGPAGSPMEPLSRLALAHRGYVNLSDVGQLPGGGGGGGAMALGDAHGADSISPDSQATLSYGGGMVGGAVSAADSQMTYSYGPEEPDDYRCCECGRWVPDYADLHWNLLDPWGYGLCRSTYRHALIGLDEMERDPLRVSPTGPDREELEQVVRDWPGEVCSECYGEWTGEGVGAGE